MLLQDATIGGLVSRMKNADVIRGIQDGWWIQIVKRRLTRNGHSDYGGCWNRGAPAGDPLDEGHSSHVGVRS
eukprot:11202215-Lingulodinium_polyedra.AAC.1